MTEASVHVARRSRLFKPRLRHGCVPSSVDRPPFTVLPLIVLVLELELDSAANFAVVVGLLRTSPLRLADELDPARFPLHEFFRKRAICRGAYAIRFVFDDWFTEAGSFS